MFIYFSTNKENSAVKARTETSNGLFLPWLQRFSFFFFLKQTESKEKSNIKKVKTEKGEEKGLKKKKTTWNRALSPPLCRSAALKNSGKGGKSRHEDLPSIVHVFPSLFWFLKEKILQSGGLFTANFITRCFLSMGC